MPRSTRSPRRFAAVLSAALIAALLTAAPAPAGWKGPFDVSAPRIAHREPAVGIDAAGNGIAVYNYTPSSDSPTYAHASFRTRRGKVRRQRIQQAWFGETAA